MARIRFEDGTTVNFGGDPTPQDIEEVASSLGLSAPQLEEQPRRLSFLRGAGEFVKGAAKGVVSTATGAAALGERLFARPLLPSRAERALLETPETGETVAERLIPPSLRVPTPPQRLGFQTEQIAEFLAPSRGISRLTLGLKTVPRALREAGVFGVQRALQKGEIDEDVKTAAIAGGLFPLGGATFAGAKRLFKPVGEKIQAVVLKPTARDIQDGFKIEDVNKYKLGGSVQETLTKAQVRMNELSDRLGSLLEAKKTKLNLNKVFAETSEAISKFKQRHFGDIAANQRVLTQLQSEIKEVAGDKGLVNLVEATNVKRGAGTKGSWAFGRADPDSSAIETVYTTFYGKLKTAIERSAPPGVKEINKQISEIIPISNAALRRTPIELRNNILGITDSLSLFGALFDPRALALLGASRLSRSGTFGAYLAKLGEQLPSRTAIGRRIFGR